MSFRSPRIVIVGGGLAALETVLALHDLGEGELIQTVVTPGTTFRLRPHEVERPFGLPVPRPLDLASFLHDHGVRLHSGEVVAVDPHGRRVVCADGTDEPYDVLVLAHGAVPRARLPGAATFGLPGPPSFDEILDGARRGTIASIAFTLAQGTSWPLPLYELALLTAHDPQVREHAPALHVETGELAPLDLFGTPCARAVGAMLEEAGVGWFGAGDEPPSAAARVTLPVLEPRALRGVPVAPDGFLPVDAWCRVRGLNAVYGVGDATSMQIKQGGLSSQQAVVAARHIAAESGADVRPQPMHAVLRGRLVTGTRERFLRRDLETHRSTQRETPLWRPATKVPSAYLAPWLAAHHGDTEPRVAGPGEPGIEVTPPAASRH